MQLHFLGTTEETSDAKAEECTQTALFLIKSHIEIVGGLPKNQLSNFNFKNFSFQYKNWKYFSKFFVFAYQL